MSKKFLTIDGVLAGLDPLQMKCLKNLFSVSRKKKLNDLCKYWKY